MSNIIQLRKIEAEAARELEEAIQSLDPIANLETQQDQPHNSDMSTTTELIDAKIQAAEARMENRMLTIENDFAQIKSSMNDIKSEMKSMKWWLIGTGLTVVLGIAAFNATVLSNMVASFESGKNTATALVQAQEQQKQNDERLKAIEANLAAIAAKK